MQTMTPGQIEARWNQDAIRMVLDLARRCENREENAMAATFRAMATEMLDQRARHASYILPPGLLNSMWHQVTPGRVRAHTWWMNDAMVHVDVQLIEHDDIDGGETIAVLYDAGPGNQSLSRHMTLLDAEYRFRCVVSAACPFDEPRPGLWDIPVRP